MKTQRQLAQSSFIALLLLTLGFTVPVRGAGLLIADGGQGGVLDIKEHDVKVTINNGIAVTTVTQVFENTEDRQVEALYTFPVPKGASIAGFSMWINGKEMTGEVLEKQKAREIYNSYKQARRDPGLLEQTDYRTFEMRVFPIGPKAEQKVQVTYYQELDVDHDWATYVYPLSTVTRPDVKSRTTGKFSLTLDARSAVPIVDLQSPSHPNDFAVAKHDPTYFEASLETKAGDLSRDVVVSYQLSRPRTGVDMITSRADASGEDGYFALTLTAGDELKASDAGMDYVFLVDISGSMNDDGKLDLSRNSLGAFIDTLSPEDRFEILTFNVMPAPLFSKLAIADPANKKKAVEFLALQQARGGTELNPAIQTAYKYAADRPLNVLVISDGLTEEGDRQLLQRLITQRPKASRVFCIGVGNDVDRGMLQKLADDAGGLAAFLSKEDNFARQAAGFRRKLMHPSASDLKVEFAGGSGVQAYDLEPRKLPNLYHGMPVRIYGRYKGNGPAQVAFTGNVEGRPMRQTVTLNFAERDDSNPEIERMWAWHRVDRLLNEDRSTGSAGALDEIVRLGQAYSIATEYTSFIVLENDAEYQRWHIERKNQLRVNRDRSAQARLAEDLATIRGKAESAIGPQAAEPAPAQMPAAAPAATDSSTPAPSMPGLTNEGSPPLHSGGAIDPVIAAIVVAIAGLAYAARRRARGARSNFLES
jgi:Ca-activated chloride channel family protein